MNWTRSLPTGHILTLHGVGRECLRTRERTQLLLGFRGPPNFMLRRKGLLFALSRDLDFL